MDKKLGARLTHYFNELIKGTDCCIKAGLSSPFPVYSHNIMGDDYRYYIRYDNRVGKLILSNISIIEPLQRKGLLKAYLDFYLSGNDDRVRSIEISFIQNPYLTAFCERNKWIDCTMKYDICPSFYKLTEV